MKLYFHSSIHLLEVALNSGQGNVSLTETRWSWIISRFTNCLI